VPLPSSSCAADVSGDTCCDSAWLVGERIRTIACEGVSACLDPECADGEFRSYQTEGELQDPSPECLVVVFTGMDLRSGSTDTQRNARTVLITRLTYRVELIEGGWPNLRVDQQTNTLIPPDWEMQHALSKHARGHAEKMWRALQRSVVANTTNAAGAMFPLGTNPHVIRRGVGLGRLTPRPRPGPQIGYSIDITVDTTLP
jgi:hypothetical protein